VNPIEFINRLSILLILAPVLLLKKNLQFDILLGKFTLENLKKYLKFTVEKNLRNKFEH